MIIASASSSLIAVRFKCPEPVTAAYSASAILPSIVKVWRVSPSLDLWIST